MQIYFIICASKDLLVEMDESREKAVKVAAQLETFIGLFYKKS